MKKSEPKAGQAPHARAYQRTTIQSTLLAMAPNVTPDDRKLLAKVLGVTKPTISNYLRGKVQNNDRGLQMIEILKARIQQRESKINLLCEPLKSA